MEISTLRFGDIEVDENKLIYFRDGLPGLEEYKHFAILQFSESYPVNWIQSIDDGAVCLPVIDSFLAVPEYTFHISDEDVTELEVNSPEDLYVLSVVVIPEELEGMTMNQAAPIIINTETGQAKQIILNGGEYNVRYPVFKEICRLIKEGEADAGSVKEA
ncbi:MAG: flagellar assembly protein FliW [Oscillospiraceae bacterium]|nr:flagellar assembly protein FliW [Oscillospiraceae bacterium]